MNDSTSAYPVSTGLVWAFRRSFLGYIRRLPDGAIAAADGVSLTTDYAFHFPLDDTSAFDGTSGAGVIRFTGRVGMSGHAGAIALDLASPWLHLRGAGGVLSFTTPRADGARDRVALFDVADVHPVEAGDILQWNGMRPLLNEAGAELFESNYPVGLEFDPLAVRIPLPK